MLSPDEVGEIGLLYDFYGQLLSEKQKSFFQSYYEEDYSLAEIAKEHGVSRQAVFDGIKKAEKALHQMEETLGLVKKFQETQRALDTLDETIEGLISLNPENIELCKELSAMRLVIDKLND